MLQTKLCVKCNISKELDRYYADIRTFDGRKSVCKACQYSRTKELRRENKTTHKYYIAPTGGMTNEEIARALKISPMEVSASFTSGMRKLRRIIRGNPALAETLWAFMEENLDKAYRPVVKSEI